MSQFKVKRESDSSLHHYKKTLEEETKDGFNPYKDFFPLEVCNNMKFE
jgi:hypothetical protein